MGKKWKKLLISRRSKTAQTVVEAPPSVVVEKPVQEKKPEPVVEVEQVMPVVEEAAPEPKPAAPQKTRRRRTRTKKSAAN